MSNKQFVWVRRMVVLCVLMVQWLMATAQCSVAGGQCPADNEQLTYDALFLQAMVERQKDNGSAAFELLRRCVEINPKASEAYFFLSQYYDALKDKDRSLAAVKTAAELQPDNDTYMETLAHAYIDNQQYQEGIDVVEHLYDSHRDRVDLLETLYELYKRCEDYDKAVGALERLEAIDGRNERTAYTKAHM